MGGDHASRMGNKKDVYVDLVGTSEGKRPLGRLKRSRRTLLKWIFKNWRLRGMNWIDVAQDKDRWRALVYVVMNLLVP